MEKDARKVEKSRRFDGLNGMKNELEVGVQEVFQIGGTSA